MGATWIHGFKLTAGDPAAKDQFGTSVSLSARRALVGSPQDDDGGPDSGSAYLFQELGTWWFQEAKLTPSDAAANDTFGTSVALSDALAVVGAPAFAAAGTGSVYVFEKLGAQWLQTARLIASDAAPGDFFGVSVALASERILVGATGDDDGGLWSGSAYVFERQGTLWVETAKLVASDAAASDQFGTSVSLSGDRALIGASGNGDAGTYSGSAYVFELSGTSWLQVAKLTASDAAAFDRFGESVSLAGHRALVGASQQADEGAAYLFDELGGTWVETLKLLAPDIPYPADDFGTSVSLEGDRGLIGRPGYTVGNADFVFWLGPCITPPTPGTVGSLSTVTVTDIAPGAVVGLGFAFASGLTPVGPICPDLFLELDSPQLVGLTTADVTGSATFSGFVPPSLSAATVFLQGVDLSACKPTNLVEHGFP